MQGHKDLWFQELNDLNVCSELDHSLAYVKVFVTRTDKVVGLSSSQVSHAVRLPLCCFVRYLAKHNKQRWVSSTILQMFGVFLEHQLVTASGTAAFSQHVSYT